jgi:hypothetical protein
MRLPGKQRERVEGGRVVKDRDLLKTRMKITALYLVSSHTNLLAMGQRRYAIKRNRSSDGARISRASRLRLTGQP